MPSVKNEIYNKSLKAFRLTITVLTGSFYKRCNIKKIYVYLKTIKIQQLIAAGFNKTSLILFYNFQIKYYSVSKKILA